MFRLRAVIEGVDRLFPLVGEEVRIGRSADNDIRLADPSVSRHHALIERTHRGWQVRDLDSTNGTKVNGERVGAIRLVVGDELKIGAFDLMLEEVTETGVGAPPADRSVPLSEPPTTRRAPGSIHGRVAAEAPATPVSLSLPETDRPVVVGPPGIELTKPGAFVPRPSSAPPPPPVPTSVPNATIVRPLKDFSAAFGPDLHALGGLGAAPASGSGAGTARGGGSGGAQKADDGAWSQRIFGHLAGLARLLIQAGSVPEVLERVMGLVFEALPVERGFILLQETERSAVRSEGGAPHVICELARIGEKVIHRPEEGVPVSQTILEAVMEDRLALLTYDALSDERLHQGDSIRLHGIRAAMSVPLWDGERIIGVLQVDSSVQTGAFRERDLDFLTAVANFAAVAIERLRSVRRVEVERHLRARFERYHSPSVIEEMLSEAGAELDGGGVLPGAVADGAEGAAPSEALRTLRTTEASVLFADLVGFTAFAEQAAPEEVAELLEGYFNHAVEAVFAAGGTLDKFIGDAVMAFFGAPYAQPDHALRAVRAAVATSRALTDWNRERAAAGLPVLELRIAVNSGPVVVGDVGSRRRVDYTVLGNTVNVAARLESLVAGPGEIVIGAETHRQLDGTIETEPLGELQLKGLQQKISAHRVVL